MRPNFLHSVAKPVRVYQQNALKSLEKMVVRLAKMDAIRVAGHIDENGHVQIDEAVDLPPGQQLSITIEAITPEMLTADDALWDEKFSRTPHILTQLAAEARAEIEAGTVTDFDPDADEF